MNTEAPGNWVEFAARLPLTFAQVREDPRIDAAIVRELPRGARVLMIASGGCTAALLAGTAGLSHLHLVDMNPAQMALARVKLRLLETAEPPERLEILGHRPQPTTTRRAALHDILAELALPADVLGPVDLVAELGPDHAGRYEIVFRELRRELADPYGSVVKLLQLRSTAEQSARVHPATPFGARLDAAFERVMSLEHLVALFGSRATANRQQPFSRHFAERTRHVLATLPAADNPFLWQIFAGRFPERVVYDWLALPRSVLPPLACSTMTMADALAVADPASCDLVHLSNILDWIDPAEARDLLGWTARALKPGGKVIIRQLNSRLDIRAQGLDVEWLGERIDTLHADDRSFFYRRLHVGRKR